MKKINKKNSWIVKKTDIKNLVDGLNNRTATAKGQPGDVDNNL